MESQIYFFGETEGRYIKVGWSKDWPGVKRRLRDAERDFHCSFEFLAVVPGSRQQEKEILSYFDADRARTEFPRREEIFYASPELVEYVNWLRSQWFTTLSFDDHRDGVFVGWEFWNPSSERRIPKPLEDPTRLVQVNRSFTGHLAASAWAWMAMPNEIGEDFYTPPEIVETARDVMGGIDLDPASHWIANRKLQIDTIYHRGRSAFDNPWFGRVWLNPPHGDYGPWFDRITEFVEKRELEELCMIAPAWAFTTQRAQPFMRNLVTATIVLSPTPKFWGSPTGGEGSNHPHFLVYVGEETDAFLSGFEPFGIPVEIRSGVRV